MPSRLADPNKTPTTNIKESRIRAYRYAPWQKDAPTLNNTDDGLTTCPLEAWRYWTKQIGGLNTSKLFPIHTIILNPDSLDVTRWWYEFLIEVDAISAHDRVFKDLTWR